MSQQLIKDLDRILIKYIRNKLYSSNNMKGRKWTQKDFDYVLNPIPKPDLSAKYFNDAYFTDDFKNCDCRDKLEEVLKDKRIVSLTMKQKGEEEEKVERCD
jgi:hypothetical protein